MSGLIIKIAVGRVYYEQMPESITNDRSIFHRKYRHLPQSQRCSNRQASPKEKNMSDSSSERLKEFRAEGRVRAKVRARARARVG